METKQTTLILTAAFVLAALLIAALCFAGEPATFESVRAKVRAYVDTNGITPAQLAAVKPYQVANALSLTDAERAVMGRCWNSLRRQIVDAWRLEKEAADYQRFVTAARDRILAQFPNAAFEREGMVVTIWLEGRQ
jgi:hypothetical protein